MPGKKIVYCDELAGHTVRLVDGTIVLFQPTDEDPGGGVREPRKPKPKVPAASV